ncbi:MAG: hypothetical protein ACI9F9_001750, partial [Candidatus Paceibacteria bacterium]
MNRLLASLLLVLLGSPPLLGDMLLLTDGTTHDGFFIEDSGRYLFFQVRGESKARKFKHKQIESLELTFPPEAERIAADPKWSPERVQAALDKYFLPEEAEEIEIVRSKHYILYSTAPGVDRMVKAMEEIYKAFEETFPFEEPKGASLLPVYLLKDHG